MLIEIDLDKNINNDSEVSGLDFCTEITDDGLKKFVAYPKKDHENWKDFYERGGTEIFIAGADKTTGVYWGWNFDNSLDYFNVNLVSRFPNFDSKTGMFYSDKEFSEFFTNHDIEVTSTGKPIPSFDNMINSYGVADNIDQILDYYSSVSSSTDFDIVIGVAPIVKSQQPAQDGWRWHKWGKYIGSHTPQHEYLVDEEDIDEVLIFHVCVVEKTV